MPKGDKWFLKIASLDQHSHPGRGNCFQVESLHIQTVEAGRNTGHVYHLKQKKEKYNTLQSLMDSCTAGYIKVSIIKFY